VFDFDEPEYDDANDEFNFDEPKDHHGGNASLRSILSLPV
jgi:hypothetical protein